MGYTINNLHFLWAAYLLVVMANAGYVLWLRKRWAIAKRQTNGASPIND